MAHVFGDRVQETIVSPGTAAFALGTPAAGYVGFAAIPAIAAGDTVDYLALGSGGLLWEVGRGTYSAGSLARTTIYCTSAGPLTPVNFGGNVTLANTLTAEMMRSLAMSVDASLLPDTPGAIGTLWVDGDLVRRVSGE